MTKKQQYIQEAKKVHFFPFPNSVRLGDLKLIPTFEVWLDVCDKWYVITGFCRNVDRNRFERKPDLHSAGISLGIWNLVWFLNFGLLLRTWDTFLTLRGTWGFYLNHLLPVRLSKSYRVGCVISGGLWQPRVQFPLSLFGLDSLGFMAWTWTRAFKKNLRCFFAQV